MDNWCCKAFFKTDDGKFVDKPCLFQTNMLQGNVDVSFRVKGSKGAGTLYFTSIRKEKGQPFTVCESTEAIILHIISDRLSTVRYKIICDDGTTVNLPVGLSKQ